MQIELSQDELETIGAALEVWESNAKQDAFMGSLFGAMLGAGKGEREEKEKARTEESFKKADAECKQRKMKSLLIRAKLAGAITSQLTDARQV